MRISNRARAEFEFYRDTTLDMIGGDVLPLTGTDDGRPALECWFAKDTHGKTLPCSEPELLEKVQRGKASVNLQVKLWAEDIADGILLRQAELVRYVQDWPDWVLRAVMEQAGKITMQTVGFVPRFARAEYLFGNLWLPEMDDFDAGI